jgi:nucleoside-diphosphate-sugar epimerase
MELACAPWRDKGIDLCFLRIGNVAGADALLMNVASAAPDAPIAIDLFADGRGPLRSYIGPRSMAAVLWSLCRHEGPLPPVLNLAAPVPVHMEELATAAGHPWSGRNASGQGHQTITLNCNQLTEIHSFDRGESTPAEMIRQWRDS